MQSPTDRRIELHHKLEALIGSEEVHFQPPSNIQMRYPCIVYERSNNHTRFANDHLYRNTRRYTLTVIDKNPDTALPDKVLASMQYVSLNRVFTYENLNHYVFDIYY